MDPSLLVLVIGLAVVASVLLEALSRRLSVPSLVGHLLLGLGLAVLDRRVGLLSREGHAVFEFLGTVGVIALLFRVGLRSNLGELRRRLGSASLIWSGDVTVNLTGGFLASYFLLGAGLIPSLLVAVALTATSVGIPARIWESAGALETPSGELFLDVAELDDLSGVLLLTLVFAVIPELRGGGSEGALAGSLALEGALLLGKLLLFAGACYLFAHYVEARATRWFERFAPPSHPMLLIAATGFVIAAAAGLLGFSVAIGAFFAGLAFSRDPEAVRTESSFDVLYDFFVPFFFIDIGLSLDPSALGGALIPGLILLGVAVSGKVLGAMGPAFLVTDRETALRIGASMIPRAEIALLVLQRGLSLGPWAVPPEILSAMVLVVAATCLISPWLLSRMLRTPGGAPQAAP